MNIGSLVFNRQLGLSDLFRLSSIFRLLFSRLSRPRVALNALRFLFFGAILKRPQPSWMPLYAVLEPSSRCNFRCKMCWRSLYKLNREECDMPYGDFKEIVDKIGDYLVFVVLWNYGEPLLNPDIDKMISYCSSKGIITVLSTNASLLDGKRGAEVFGAGLKYLIIGVDAASAEVYSKYRGGPSFQEIEANVKEAVAWKKKNRHAFPVIELQFIVMKDNEHQAGDFLSLARQWGADRVSLKRFSALRESGRMDEFMPAESGYILDCYKRPAGSRDGLCLVPWQATVVNADGEVLPCCSDYFSIEKMGNAFREDIRKIWNNDRYALLRGQLKKGVTLPGICRNCPHGNGHAGSFAALRYAA